MIEIKEMAADSVAICAELYRGSYKNEPWNEEYSVAEITDYLFRFLNSKTKRAYMLVVDGEIIGVALGLIVPFVGSDYFRLEDICLSPQHQRSGFGSEFIKLISDRISFENCDSILLGTQRGYPAHHFYLKNGFTEIDSILLYKQIKKQ